MPKKKDYDPNDVAQPVPEYEAYMALLDLPHSLLGGTLSMRGKKQQYLPKEEAEGSDAYKNRLNRSFLLNEFDSTVDKLAGEVFSEPIILPDGMNEEIQTWTSDIDLSGHNVDRFARNVFEAGLVDGVVHILVELPRIQTQVNESGKVLFWDEELEEPAWRPLTIEAMNQKGWRPYFVQIYADQIIGWRFEEQKGKQVLIQLRIREIIDEPDGRYGVKKIERIRVLEPGGFEIFERQPDREGKEDEWISIEKGSTGFDFIPLVTWLIGDPLSQMTCKPPLDDLAWLNLSHWQSSSDQRNILHYARMITYFGKGLDIDPDKKQKSVLGANIMVHSDQEFSDLKVVEHSGAAIEAGRNDLKDLEIQMRAYGLGLLLGQKPGGVTATEKAIDTAETDNSLKSWALSFQGVFNEALKIAANIMQMDESAVDEGIKVNTDFKSFLRSIEVRELREAWNDGLLPRQIVIEELQRRGVINSELDFEELMIMLQNEENNFQTTE